MKFPSLVACIVGLALTGSCRLHREPIVENDEATLEEPVPPAAPDAGRTTPDASAAPMAPGRSPPPTAPPIATADAGTRVEPDGGGGSRDGDDGLLAPPEAPLMAGLMCGDMFCPLAAEPAKACCTTPEDVTAGVARAGGRCGMDLSALQSSAYTSGCWEREQLGVLDYTCPQWGEGERVEPGCCATSGECGSLNAEHKLGCRNAPGSEPRACGDQSAGKSCDPLGTYGIRIRVDVTWGGRAGFFAQLTEAGRGYVEVFLGGTIRGVDAETGALDLVGRVCGANLPAFSSATLCESYHPGFPPELWDSPALPELPLKGRYECAETGCSLSIEPLTYLLGIELYNPESAWPSADRVPTLLCRTGRGEDCFPDNDGDGLPGVQVRLQSEGMVPSSDPAVCNGMYRRRSVPLAENLAVILDGARRADRALLGVRTKLGGSIRLGEDCDRATGSALADYVNARAYGCVLEEGTYNTPRVWEAAGPNELCTAQEARFADAALPVYTLLAAGEQPAPELNLSDTSASRGPEVSLIRFGSAEDAIDCLKVREGDY